VTATSFGDVTLRGWRGPADSVAIADLYQGCKAWDHVDPLSVWESTPSLDDVGAALKPRPGLDPYRDVCLVEAAGEAVGYSRVTWWTERDGLWLYLSLAQLLPAWRGRGVGSRMLAWAEGRIREIAAGHPHDGKAMFGANASSTEREATALLREAGYTAAFSVLEMGLDFPCAITDAPLPASLDLRLYAPAHSRPLWDAIQAVYASTRRTHSPTEEDYQRWARDPAHQPELWFVAWNGERIAGQVLCAITGRRAEIVEVGVSDAWRRRGVASALLTHALQVLQTRGVGTVRLHTLNENTSAQALYTRLGFRLLKEFPRYRKLLT